MGRKLFWVCVLSAIPWTQGCLYWGGSTKTVQPTIGQQLTDLKAAHDKGILNEAEYQRQRIALLEGRGGSEANETRTASTSAAPKPKVANSSWDNLGK